MEIQPYVFFDGRCEEALSFYADKLGAEVLFKMHYKDAPPDANRPRRSEDRTTWSCMPRSRSARAILMMSDDCMSDSGDPQRFQAVADGRRRSPHGEKLFNALAEGGKVDMPWQATFWTKGFGMVTDQFGIGWMVTIPDGQLSAAAYSRAAVRSQGGKRGATPSARSRRGDATCAPCRSMFQFGSVSSSSARKLVHLLDQPLAQPVRPLQFGREVLRKRTAGDARQHDLRREEPRRAAEAQAARHRQQHGPHRARLDSALLRECRTRGGIGCAQRAGRHAFPAHSSIER